jgi:hypothetical protein
MVEIEKQNANTYNWGLSRVASQIIIGTQDPVDLELPNNLVITARNTQDPIDGLEQHNGGYAYGPQRFTFTLDIPVNTASYRYLREVALRRIQFRLRVSEDKSDNPNISIAENPIQIREYEGLMEELYGCVFDEFSEPFRVGTLPVVTFTGKALRFRTSNDITKPNETDQEYGAGLYDTNIPEV